MATDPQLKKLQDAIEFVETFHPLPRCDHGNCLRDGAGEILEPFCGCRMPSYDLDPDFRRGAPDGDVPYCARCQKKVDPAKAKRVTVCWETWKVSEGGNEFVGQDCWKAITKGKVDGN